MLRDRDLFDGPTEITREDGDSSVVVVFSDRPAHLSGTFQKPGGAPISDIFVIVFSASPKFWTRGSRRVQAVRPSIEGRFMFTDLPPGDYPLGVLMDVDQDEWQDPLILQNIAAQCVKVSVVAGQTTVQDFRFGGG